MSRREVKGPAGCWRSGENETLALRRFGNSLKFSYSLPGKEKFSLCCFRGLCWPVVISILLIAFDFRSWLFCPLWHMPEKN